MVLARLGLVVFLSAAGCGLHLGDNYGRRTRAALDAQIGGRNQGANPIDGEDAKQVMARHRGRGGPGTLGGQTGSTVTGGTFVGGSSGQGAPIMLTPSATPSSGGRGIGSLDAVR
jgi:hypothetical protein